MPAQQTISDGPVLIGVIDVLGTETTALADTASDYTVFDNSFKARLGKPSRKERVKTTSGNVEATFFPAPPIKLHEQVVLSGEVAALDLSYMKRTSGINIECILGTDVLAQGTLQFDNRSGKWSWTMDPVLPAAAALKCPLIPRDGKKCAVSIDIPEAGPTLFYLDTGYISVSSSGCLSAEVAKRLEAADQIVPLRTTRSIGPANGEKNQVGLLRSPAGIGSLKLNNLIFTRGQFNLLGMNFFSRFSKVIIDFRRHELWIEPGDSYDHPDVVDRSGLRIWKPTQFVSVFEVQPGSPGAACLIQSGDTISHVNDERIDDMPLNRLRRLLSAPPVGDSKAKPVKLRIQRGDRTFDAVIALDIWPDSPDLRPRKRLPQ